MAASFGGGGRPEHHSSSGDAAIIRGRVWNNRWIGDRYTERLQVKAGMPMTVVNWRTSNKAVLKVKPYTVVFKSCGLYKRSLKLEGGLNCLFYINNMGLPSSHAMRPELDEADIAIEVYAITFPVASRGLLSSCHHSSWYRPGHPPC